MSDKEIIEKLEHLLNLGDAPIGYCFGVIIDKKTISETLNLINKQQKAIKMLEENISVLRVKLEFANEIHKKDLESLKDAHTTVQKVNKRYSDKCKELKGARIATARELVEKMKKVAEPFLAKENGVYLLSTQDIKDLLEEVVGEDDG